MREEIQTEPLQVRGPGFLILGLAHAHAHAHAIGVPGFVDLERANTVECGCVETSLNSVPFLKG